MKKFLLILITALAACSQVQNSSSQAFDNANSVLKNGLKDEPIWMEPEASPSKAPAEQ